MIDYVALYLLSILNVICITGLALNHALRGLDDWWIIALLLIPASLIVWSIERVD